MRWFRFWIVLCAAALLIGCSSGGDGGDAGTDSGSDSDLEEADSDLDSEVADGDGQDDADIDEVVDADFDPDVESGDADIESDAEMDGDVEADVDVIPDWWGEPVEAPAHEWTWIDFPRSMCADGSATGIGVNLSPGATRALIYLEGGGACWNYSNCFGIVGTSLHLDGFDEGSFDGLIADVFLSVTWFDRDEPKNPFADAHLVFVPYCTGDVHGGDNVVDMEGLLPWERGTIYFNGHNNLREYMARLVPTFEDVDRVVLAGSSAGGFGAGLSWWYVQEAFGDTRVDCIDDSGPPVRPSDGLWEEWIEAWNLQLPSECVDCETGPDAVVAYYRDELMTESRFALMSYTRDTVISAFMGILPMIFEERLMVMLDMLDEVENAQYFIVSGRMHTLTMIGYEDLESARGLPLWYWVDRMVDDDPDWGSERP